MALGLGIDSRLIHDGPVEAIVSRVHDYISRAARNGRLTLIINNVPGDTPPAYIHAAVAAARFYGLYPIGEHLEELPFVLPENEPFATLPGAKVTCVCDLTGSWLSHDGPFA